MLRRDTPGGLSFARGRNNLVFDAYEANTAANSKGVGGGYWIVNYTSDVAATGIGSHNHTVKWQMLSGQTFYPAGRVDIASTPVCEIPESEYFVNNVGFEVLRQSAGAGHSPVDVWFRNSGDRTYHSTKTTHTWDGEIGFAHAYWNDLNNFLMSTEDQRSFRESIETSNWWHMMSTMGGPEMMNAWVTYHSITFDISGTISNADPANDVVITVTSGNINLPIRSHTVSADPNGAYSFKVFDDTVGYTLAAIDGLGNTDGTVIASIATAADLDFGAGGPSATVGGFIHIS
jgi:hypothetical protein